MHTPYACRIVALRRLHLQYVHLSVSQGQHTLLTKAYNRVCLAPAAPGIRDRRCGTGPGTARSLGGTSPRATPPSPCIPCNAHTLSLPCRTQIARRTPISHLERCEKLEHLSPGDPEYPCVARATVRVLHRDPIVRLLALKRFLATRV